MCLWKRQTPLAKLGCLRSEITCSWWHSQIVLRSTPQCQTHLWMWRRNLGWLLQRCHPLQLLKELREPAHLRQRHVSARLWMEVFNLECPIKIFLHVKNNHGKIKSNTNALCRIKCKNLESLPVGNGFEPKQKCHVLGIIGTTVNICLPLYYYFNIIICYDLNKWIILHLFSCASYAYDF